MFCLPVVQLGLMNSTARVLKRASCKGCCLVNVDSTGIRSLHAAMVRINALPPPHCKRWADTSTTRRRCSSSEHSEVRVRFAPSPTGKLLKLISWHNGSQPVGSVGPHVIWGGLPGPDDIEVTILGFLISKTNWSNFGQFLK